ncbi:MAG: A/G-specific adenine glycosylase [Planctomyces sp.]
MSPSRSKPAVSRSASPEMLAETVVAPTLQTPAGRHGLQRQMLKWYACAGRQLPWRQSRDPYRIWLSEIMLQQTTVAAVIPYFERFTAAFPDVKALAAAPLDDVLRLWEGLGYYSRARNLHRAAGLVVSEHGGQFPADAVQLQKLPGIGRYTAGAIASFAFDLPAPIVEANTERLYARLLGLQLDVRSAAGQKQLWAFAESIVSTERPGDFNQSVMDLGARICTPTSPRCSDCPVREYCGAFRLGLQHELPRKPPRAPVTAIAELAVIPMRVQQGRRQFLLRRRDTGERWAGMWDAYREETQPEILDALPVSAFQTKPRSRVGSLFSAEHDQLPAATLEQVKQQSGAVLGAVTAALQLTYAVTRFKVRLTAVVCRVHQSPRSLPDGWSWHAQEDLGELPLSKTGRQITDWLQQFGN